MPAYRDLSGKVPRWRYRTRVTLPNGKVKRISGCPRINNKAAAQDAERKHIERVLNPSAMPAPVESPRKEQTFKSFVEEFYLPKMRATGNKRGKNKPGTLNAKESHLKIHFYPRWGSSLLSEIDDIAIEDLKIELGEMGRKPKTINNITTTLYNVLKNAQKRKLIASVPAIEWLPVGQQEFDFFDFEEADRLIEGAEKIEEWTCAVIVALKTGMRLGELRALRWDDVDLKAGNIIVRRNLWRGEEGTPKNGKTRTIDLPASAVKALKSHRHLRGDRVFLNTEGKNYTLGEWRWGLYRACKRAGLRVVGWHVLRHTFASHLIMRAVPIRTVQELMGHSTIAMTMRYAHLSPGVTRAAVAKLDEPAPDFGKSGQELAKSPGKKS